MMVRRKSDTDAEQAVSGSENRGKEWLISFLHSRKGRMTVCACAAAVLLTVVIIAVLVHNAGDGEPAEKWPTGALMEGIQPPEQGKIGSVYETDSAVTVYFEEFPEKALAAYLKTLGASPAGSFTYVAQKKDRILAVVYDPAEKQLSLTVTSTK